MSEPRFTFTSRARPFCQVGRGASSTTVGVGAARWDVSLWDDAGFADWAGTEPTWTDASTYVVRADLFAGRQRVTDAFVPGRADIMFDNNTGWANGDVTIDELPIGAGLYDPSTLTLDEDPDGSGLYRIMDVDVQLIESPAGSGLYNLVRGTVVPGSDFLATLVLGQQIRVGVDHDVYGLVWLWRGFIDDIEPVYDADNGCVVTVRALDPLGEVGRVELARIVDEADDEGASTRVTNILDAAPWTTSKRIIDVIATGLVAAKLDGKVVDLLRRCAESVGGWIFGDTDGNVVLRASSWLNPAASRHEEFTITNDATIVDPTKVCPTRWSRPHRRRDIAARVVFGIEGGDPITRESQTVIDDYGAEPYTIRDLWTKSVLTLTTLADRILTTRSPAYLPRIDSVTINVDTDQDAAVDIATLVSVTTPTRLRCRHLDPNTGDVVFDDQCFATGVTHQITADSWTVDIALDRSDPFAIALGPYLWDVADWDQAQWN